MSANLPWLTVSMFAPSFSKRPAGDELPGVDADRSGQRARLRDDDVAGGGHVVPAGRGQVRHRDDRPAAPWSFVIISSRQITSDATDDPPGLSIRRMMAFAPLPRASPDVLDERVRTQARSIDGIEAALAADDRAHGVDHGDARVVATRRAPPRSQRRSRRLRSARRATHVADIVELVLVGELVDQPFTRSASSGRNGPRSISARTSSSGLRRPSAIARTSCWN